MRHLYDVLEFNIIKEKVASFAATKMGKEYIENLEHSTDIHEIRLALSKSDEAMRIIYSFGTCPLSQIHDISMSLIKAKKNAVLNIEELYRIASNIEAVQNIKTFKGQVNNTNIDSFNEYVDSLVYLHYLSKKIFNVISPNLEILDNASSTLNKIRKEIKKITSEIKSKMDSYMQSNSEYLSDEVVTRRNDRLVIPVKSTYKHQIQGIIHDESSSGNTSFVEPTFAVLLNAKLDNLRNDETIEINRILRMLSSDVADDVETLLNNQKYITELDIMFAKGQYGKSIDGQVPLMVNEPTLVFKHARHPLIEKKKVVANDISLGGECNKILLISGPNTGGKTVYLKLTGLLVLMAQAGIPLPVDGEAKLSVFNNVFVDIGDEQSIEQSLSTFSSHMEKIISMVDEVDDKSLVILDELGGGTDPKEGESIAMAFIEYLHKKNSFAVVTTHYSNLKVFALEQGYIENGSMLFDEENMKPQYHLALGVIGKSYALEISKRLGLDNYIIDRARYYKDYYMSQSEKLEEKLEEKMKLIHQKEEENLKVKAEIEKLKEEIIKEKELIVLEKEKIKTNAQEMIDDLVGEAMKEIDQTVEQIKNKEKEDLKMHEWIAAKKTLKTYLSNDEDDSEDVVDLKVGDFVRLKTMNKTGTIVRTKGEKYMVDCGGMTITVSGSDFQRWKKVEEKKTPFITSSSGLKHVNAELNIIGLHIEEALPKLEKYIDDARSVHLKNVRIIHGHGTGALRKMVHDYLKGKKFVEDYHLGGAGEGGVGATVVTLK